MARLWCIKAVEAQADNLILDARTTGHQPVPLLGRLENEATSGSEEEEAPRAPVRLRPKVFQPEDLPAEPVISAEEVHEIKRAKQGKVIALSSAIKALYTYRKPSAKKPHGGYQIRCYHHKPDELFNKNGKKYHLYCRKELSIPSEDLALATLATLGQWALSAEHFATRLEHQALQPKPVQASSQPAQKPAKAKARTGATRSSSSSSSSRPNVLRSPWPQASPGVLTQGDYALRDVPGDGDCLFSALGLEIENKAVPGLRLPSGRPGTAMGPRWRGHLVAAVRDFAQANKILDGHNILQWIELTGWANLDSYISAMTLAEEQPGDAQATLGRISEALRPNSKGPKAVTLNWS